MPQKDSWYNRTFGRSVFNMIFGNFFQQKNNASSIIALALILTFCSVVIHMLLKENLKDDIIETLANFIFVITGYYFGSKQGRIEDDGSD